MCTCTVVSRWALRIVPLMGYFCFVVCSGTHGDLCVSVQYNSITVGLSPNSTPIEITAELLLFVACSGTHGDLCVSVE